VPHTGWCRIQHPHLQLPQDLLQRSQLPSEKRNAASALSASRKATVLDGVSWVEKTVAVTGGANVIVRSTCYEKTDHGEHAAYHHKRSFRGLRRLCCDDSEFSRGTAANFSPFKVLIMLHRFR
jgi:hypothetical protein